MGRLDYPIRVLKANKEITEKLLKTDGTNMGSFFINLHKKGIKQTEEAIAVLEREGKK